MASVSFHEVRKRYGELEVIHGVSTEVADGEFVVIVLMQKWFVRGLVETEK